LVDRYSAANHCARSAPATVELPFLWRSLFIT
jgi:hypothetical protein